MEALPNSILEYPPTTAEVEILPNGLTLILDPDDTAPVVSAQVWVESGSIHEDEHLGSGLSHFLEHMVFKGTRDYDSDTLATTVQAHGGHWNAYTTFDRTVYYIDGPSKSLPEFLKCLSGLVWFPTLPESEFANEQDVIRREIDMGLDDPDNASTRLMLATSFQADPRRHPVIGHRHRFDSLVHQDLVDYHRKRYTSDRSFLVISGDFDPAVIRELVIELTADCLPHGGREPLAAEDPPQMGPRYARETFAVPTSRISLTWKCPPLHHPDCPAFDLLSGILGSGRSSLLYQELRESQQLALEISAYCWSFPGREGLIGISAECAPEQRENLLEGILQQLRIEHSDRLVSMLAKAKRQLAASQFRTLTSASGRASDLASNWHEARDLDFTRRYLQAAQEVTVDDILRVASTLTESGRCLTILDPLDAPAPSRKRKPTATKCEIEVHSLPNGIPLILLPDHRVPMVHLQVAARAGMLAESPDNQGINQLLASTLPKGTTSRSAAEIAEQLESLGASLNANTGNNALLVQAGGLAPDIDRISEVFADTLSNPLLADAAIAREKASQQAALEESLQNPLQVGIRSLRQAMFGKHGYGLNPLGSPTSLDSLDHQALVSHHARHFNPANFCLAIAGDFDPAAMADEWADRLTSLPSGTRWQPEPSHIESGGDITSHLPKKQAVLAIGFAGAAADSEDRHALAFLQDHASDMAGPLFLRIREQLGLAYQVGATQFLGYDCGLFAFYAACSPEQVDQCRSELLGQIEAMATHGIPDDAFERVRSTVLSGLAIQQQSIAAQARHAAINTLFGLPADENRRLAQTYEALCPDDVRRVAQRLLSAKPTIATVLPE